MTYCNGNEKYSTPGPSVANSGDGISIFPIRLVFLSQSSFHHCSTVSAITGMAN